MRPRPEVVLAVVGSLFLALGVGAAATGLSTQQARTAAPSTITGATAANTEGSSLSFARADHGHATNYTATGAGAVARSFASKLGDVVSVKDFGAVGDGVNNDTTAINNAITALGGAGGRVYFPPGTYMAATITLPSNVWLMGSGTNATTLKMPNGANADVVQGANFLTLTNTTYQSPENRGANFTRISDMTIDGNKANNSTGYCVRIWGHSMRWSNIAFQNGPSGNIWTEYAGGDGWSLHASDPKQGDPESSFEHIKSNTAGTVVNTPVNATFTLGAGSLATGTYYYRVTALNALGETVPSAETSLAITGPAGVNVNWGAVTGATGYKIYGRTTGAELLIATVGTVTTYLDNGSVTPVGALPTAGTTGSDGWTFRGPHDSSIADFISSGNAGWAIKFTSSANRYTSAGTIGFQWNEYGDVDGFSFGPNSTPLAISYLTASSVNRGLFTDATNGSSNFTHIVIAGCYVYGATLQGQHNFFQGELSRNHSADNTSGDGLIIANLLDSYVIVHGDTNKNAISVVSESGGNTIFGNFNVTPASPAGTLYTGTFHTQSMVNLQQYNASNVGYFQYPATAAIKLQTGTITNTNGANALALDDGAIGPRLSTYDQITFWTNNPKAERFRITANGVKVTGSHVTSRTAPTYGASVAIDATLGNEFVITATNGTAFTVANPTSPAPGQRISIRVRNTFGVLGALTFDTLYKAAAWTQPANGFSRAIDFQYDGTNWIEVSRTPSDVPN